MVILCLQQRWGIHVNREIEVNYSHKNYFVEFGPRRNRLTHSLLFEEFEMIVENWQDLDQGFKEKGTTPSLLLCLIY